MVLTTNRSLEYRYVLPGRTVVVYHLTNRTQVTTDRQRLAFHIMVCVDIVKVKFEEEAE
jgi:hypothetical protein